MHVVQQAGQRITRHETPATVEEALDLLARHGQRARPVAGATDLLIELDRGGRPGVEVLVDLSRLTGLDRIDESGGTFSLGPLVTHNQVVASEALVARALPLAQACLEVGSPQLRNRATVVGNVVTASPANDTISALLALDASVTVRSRRGQRTVPLSSFQTGFRATDLAPDELVTGLSFPALTGARRGLFAKLGLRRAQAISVLHVAVVADVDDAGRISDPRVVLGSVAPTVVRSAEAEAVLAGAALDARTIERAAAAARASVAPIDDVRATAEYRSDQVEVVVARVLQALAAGAQGAAWPAEPVLLWGRAGGSPTGGGPPGGTAAAHDDASRVDATVNGRPVSAPGAASRTLLDWLRDEVGLTGTKEGCAEGECGACTVHLDGLAVMACLVPAARAHGAEVVTIEGLAATGPAPSGIDPEAGDGEAAGGDVHDGARPGGDAALHPLQQAFVDRGAVQCGYCIPGFLMAGAKLLEERPHPAPDQVRQGLSGNLCRCTGYYSILAAVDDAAAQLRGAGPR